MLFIQNSLKVHCTRSTAHKTLLQKKEVSTAKNVWKTAVKLLISESGDLLVSKFPAITTLVESNEGKVPKIFYESEGWGKEPLFVMVGKDPISVVEKMEEVKEEFVEWRKKK